MDESNQTSQRATQENVPNPPLATLPVASPSSKKSVLVAALIALSIGFIALFAWKTLSFQSPIVSTPSPTPTVSPTPRIVRVLSSIATESTFLSLESRVASLSAAIGNYVVEDPILSPPVLDLPLGFQR